MASYDIAVVGELNADLLLSGDVEPRWGQVERLVDDASLVLGSSSAIFAAGAARLGLRVAFFGIVGADALGGLVLDELRRRGIDTAGCVVDAAVSTGLTVILSRGADRAMLTFLGSIAALRLQHIDLERLCAARHLHLGSYFLLSGLKPDVPRLFDIAREHGLSVSLDTNYDPAERWDDGVRAALSRADVFLPNETEALAISGRGDAVSAARELARLAPTVAVKRGAAGALAVTASGTYTAPALAVDVVDTTGAGDTFDAGFVYARLAGWPVERALRCASICGALSTRGVGGTAAQPSLAEVLALLG